MQDRVQLGPAEDHTQLMGPGAWGSGATALRPLPSPVQVQALHNQPLSAATAAGPVGPLGQAGVARHPSQKTGAPTPPPGSSRICISSRGQGGPSVVLCPSPQ